MATDTSAALEYAVRNYDYSAWRGLIRPGSAEAGQEKLYMIEPRQPGKYPLVFVHGFFSSPIIWAQIANEILARPDLRKRYQLMAYRYPTGRPFLESATILRQELRGFVATYDPQGQDPSMTNMALVGHSMGGLVSKLIVSSSDDRLWCSVANRPLDEINVSDERRKQLFDLFYFKPLPNVRRVVFMGTPHDGAMLASTTLGQVSSRCVQQPTADLIEHNLLVQQNPGVFSPEITKRIPTSIDLLEPSSGLLQAVQTLCPGANVQLHSIIGTRCLSPLSGCSDGVVSVKSAQHPCVSTEKRVHTSHGGLHENDESIKELVCILRRHVLEADDPPGISVPEHIVPECVVPEFGIPESIMPECETPEPCPTEAEMGDPCLDELKVTDPCRIESSVLVPHRSRPESLLLPSQPPSVDTPDGEASEIVELDLEGPEL
jgi:pimeloyl-ACP methyl ester carboxylesterase